MQHAEQLARGIAVHAIVKGLRLPPAAPLASWARSLSCVMSWKCAALVFQVVVRDAQVLDNVRQILLGKRPARLHRPALDLGTKFKQGLHF